MVFARAGNFGYRGGMRLKMFNSGNNSGTLFPLLWLVNVACLFSRYGNLKLRSLES